MSDIIFTKNINSIEPQIFTNGGNIPFYFNNYQLPTQEPQGLLNSVLVQNAGITTLNGIYNYVFEFNGKPYYSLATNPSNFILWFENQWEIYSFDIDPIFPIYVGIGNVLYPWNITNWSSLNSNYDPAPVVTKIL